MSKDRRVTALKGGVKDGQGDSVIRIAKQGGILSKATREEQERLIAQKEKFGATMRRSRRNCNHKYADNRCKICGVFEPRNRWAFKPGCPGGPGRPNGLVGDALYQYLISNGCRTLKEMVAGAVQAAIEGNPKALAVIRDSVDGRPPVAIGLDATVNASVSVSLAERLERARKRATRTERR